MKRNVRAALWPLMGVLLVLLMLLPMGMTAGAAEEGTGAGFAYEPQYRSQWNEKYGIRKASWGNQWWPANDGDYNGAMFWTNNNEKISIKDEEVGGTTTGVLHIRNASGLWALFNPGGRIERGATRIRFDFRYTSGDFAGFDLSFSNNVIFRVDNAGKVYAGSTTSFGDLRSATGLSADASLDGWYTVEAFFIPCDADGNVVTVPSGASDDEVAACRARIAKNTVYVRFSSYADPLPETQGVTLADLEATARKFDWTSSNQLNFYRDLGPSVNVKPTSSSGILSIANAEATLLVPDAHLRRVTYVGTNGRRNRYAYTTDGRDTLTVPAAPGVSVWKATGADGKTGYYAPGNRIAVSGDTRLEAATGESAVRLAEFRTLVQSVGVAKPYLYTYTQMTSQIAAIDNALPGVVSALGENDPLVTEAKAERALLAAETGKIAEAAERLIAASDVFGDRTRRFADRMASYESIMHGYVDPTYAGAPGDVRVAAALTARDAFAAQYEKIGGAWKRYTEACRTIGQIVGDEAVEEAVIAFVTSDDYTALAMVFASDEPDTQLSDIYFARLAGIPQKIKKLYTITDRFNYLKQRLENYNIFKKAVFGETRTVAVPDALAEAVAYYNASVAVMNREIVSVATVNLALQNLVRPSGQAAPLLSDIRTRLDVSDNRREEE